MFSPLRTGYDSSLFKNTGDLAAGAGVVHVDMSGYDVLKISNTQLFGGRQDSRNENARPGVDDDITCILDEIHCKNVAQPWYFSFYLVYSIGYFANVLYHLLRNHT